MSFSASLVEQIKSVLQQIGLSDSQFAAEIIVSAGILLFFILVGWVVYHVFEHYFTMWAKKTKTKLDDEILANIKSPIYFFVVVLGLYYGLEFLTVLKPYHEYLDKFFLLIEVLLVAYIITRMVNVLTAWYAERQKKIKMNDHILFVLRKVINFIVALAAFLFLLNAFKIDLTGAVVGLGVGGIAIAFALQNVLSDLFSAFSIYFDRPFEIGDYVIVGEYGGTVEKIGMKSTRLKLLQGEEMVLPNSSLTSEYVRNFKKMRRRRICFGFGVTYNTPNKKLKQIPEMVIKIIEDIELADPDRVHFKEFGDSSLDFEVVYYIRTKDYTKYMDVQEQINFGIRDVFEKEKIEMAFPTRTIYIEKD